MKNKYFIRSHISEKKFREIIKLFSADLTAAQIAFLSGLSRPTINKILKQIRMCVAEFCEKESLFKKGEIDESYFGARRIRGKRGRGSYGKTIVFGLKQRKGKVYTQVIKNCSLFCMSKTGLNSRKIFCRHQSTKLFMLFGHRNIKVFI